MLFIDFTLLSWSQKSSKSMFFLNFLLILKETGIRNDDVFLYFLLDFIRIDGNSSINWISNCELGRHKDVLWERNTLFLHKNVKNHDFLKSPWRVKKSFCHTKNKKVKSGRKSYVKSVQNRVFMINIMVLTTDTKAKSCFCKKWKLCFTSGNGHQKQYFVYYFTKSWKKWQKVVQKIFYHLQIEIKKLIFSLKHGISCREVRFS